MSEPKTKPTKRDVLLRAAEILERDGWCQGKVYDGDACCMVGAFMLARIHSPVEGHPFPAWPLPDIDGMVPGKWNDAPGRTKEEVVAKLRELAEGVGEG